MSSTETGVESGEEKSGHERPLVSRVPIRVAALGELNAYIIYEHELNSLDRLDADLARDPPESVYLNFALFLFPTSLSFFISLLTTTIHSNRVYELFVIISSVSFVGSLLLLALWARDRRLYRKGRQDLLTRRAQQIATIKDRMPSTPPVQATLLPSEEP